MNSIDLEPEFKCTCRYEKPEGAAERIHIMCDMHAAAPKLWKLAKVVQKARSEGRETTVEIEQALAAVYDDF